MTNPIPYVVHDGDGRILSHGYARRLEAIGVPQGASLVVNTTLLAGLEDAWVDPVTGAPGPRPSLPAPPARVQRGDVVTLDLPAGVGVTIDGVEAGVTDGTPLEIEFATDGIFEIAFAPQWPHMARVDNVEVMP